MHALESYYVNINEDNYATSDINFLNKLSVWLNDASFFDTGHEYNYYIWNGSLTVDQVCGDAIFTEVTEDSSHSDFIQLNQNGYLEFSSDHLPDWGTPQVASVGIEVSFSGASDTFSTISRFSLG